MPRCGDGIAFARLVEVASDERSPSRLAWIEVEIAGPGENCVVGLHQDMPNRWIFYGISTSIEPARLPKPSTWGFLPKGMDSVAAAKALRVWARQLADRWSKEPDAVRALLVARSEWHSMPSPGA
jgi:hypothetical protein